MAQSNSFRRELIFDLERETKNTVRYAESGDASVIGTLYIRKLVLPIPYPQRLRVVVEAA